MQLVKSILFVTRPGDRSEPAFINTMILAQEQKADVHILVTYPDDVETAETVSFQVFNALIEAATQERADELLALVPAGIPKPRVTIRTGKQYYEAILLVQSEGHDLVIKAAEPDVGFFEKVLGSEDMHLLRKCPCAVWLMRPEMTMPPKRLLACVAMDEREGADLTLNARIIETGLELLDRSSDAELHILHLWSAPGEHLMRSARTGLSEKQVQDWISAVRKKHKSWFTDLVQPFSGRARIITHFEKGIPEARIAELAESVKASSVVMGTVGRTGISGLFIGNTAESILHQLKGSVLALKPDKFRTPIRAERDPGAEPP